MFENPLQYAHTAGCPTFAKLRWVFAKEACRHEYPQNLSFRPERRLYRRAVETC